MSLLDMALLGLGCISLGVAFVVAAQVGGRR